MEPKYPLESRFNGKTDKTIHVCSDVSTSTYFGSSEQTTKGIHRGIRLTSTSKMNYGNNSHIGESYLQITLHGISPPSRNLCASVHHMLQTRLDALVLQHISDSLSRNAINRLSMEDFLFLLNRRPEQPHLHFFISLPKFFTDNDQSLFGITVPYKPNQTVLAFCHYFRQNLLLFLTPVKLDRDTKTLLKGLGKAELFLFNRPSAQGFSKHGVATVLVQLMMVSGDKTLQMNHNPLEPYVILDWASPNEPIWTSKSCDLCCQDISNAIKDFSEVSEFDMQTHPGLIQPLPRLVLSVRMWEREHSDLSKLKLRLMNSVHHALYDLMTEYLVLTLPIFFDFDCSGVAHQDLKTTDFVTSDSRSKCVNAEDLSLNNIIFPWMKEGRNIESPLVTNVSASLSSSLFVEQLISDLLKPFISHEDVSVFDISPNASCRKTNCATEFTSVSKISCGSYSSLETPGNSCLKYDAIFGESAHMFRPGFTSEYIIVGHNLNAWRNTRGLSHTGREYKPSTFHKSSGSLSKIRLIEFISDSGNHYDASSRMQPLRVNISSNQYSSSSVSNDFNPNFKRIHRNEEISTSEARFSSGNDGRRRTVQSSDSHWCPADNCYCYGSLVSKFPEFCPVKIGMIRQIIRHPSAEASISTNLSQNDRSNSNECLNKNSLITREKCKMNVHIPRQSFCLISIDGRQFICSLTTGQRKKLNVCHTVCCYQLTGIINAISFSAHCHSKSWVYFTLSITLVS
ncbi:unnamed protein product [Heterobilharzia americana]|nr:unnamed protein product [Heterobilharzia americana]